MTTAFLALWNDYPAAFADEYEAWHTFEHVPERLTSPGIHAARRYGSKGDGEVCRYFTLYELDHLDALQHPHYLDLVRNPTPWSKKMRGHFSNVLRIPGDYIASGGRGTGAYAFVQAFSIGRSHAGAACLQLGLSLHDLVSCGQVLAYRIGLAEPNQPYEVFEQEPQTDADRLVAVVLVESSDRRGLEQIQPTLAAVARDVLRPAEQLRDGHFKLLVGFPAEEAPNNRSEIMAGEMLRSRFNTPADDRADPVAVAYTTARPGS
ncbi:MAG: hypothetical protein ACK4QP_06600 [Pseudorhizobium sp.]